MVIITSAFKIGTVLDAALAAADDHRLLLRLLLFGLLSRGGLRKQLKTETNAQLAACCALDWLSRLRTLGSLGAALARGFLAAAVGAAAAESDI